MAQALAGPVLKGSERADRAPRGARSALARLMATWRSGIEENVVTPGEPADRQRGQRTMVD